MLRDAGVVRPWQVEVEAHVHGYEETCLHPFGVSCAACKKLYAREQFKRHDCIEGGDDEARAPKAVRVGGKGGRAGGH